MREIRRPIKSHEDNGHVGVQSPRPKKRMPLAGSGGKSGQRAALYNALDRALKPSKSGTDIVEIGVGLPVPDDDIRGATMDDVEKVVNDVKYLVRDWIPFGMVTGLVAEPGGRKSALALWLARSVMTGQPWFTGLGGPKPGKVLWCPTENDMAITLQRMKDWEIRRDKLILPFNDDPLLSINLNDPEHLERIESLIIKYRTKMVAIDSLRAGHDGDENNSQVGRVLQNLAAIAERTRAAVIVVHHARKLFEGEELSANSSRGSNAIQAMFRSMIGIDRPDKDSERCRMRLLKENLGIAPQPIGFQVTSTGLEFGDAPMRQRKPTQKDEAAEWLRTQMKPGTEYRAHDLQTEGEQYGYSRKTLRRAATELLRIRPKAVREKGKITGWQWQLP